MPSLKQCQLNTYVRRNKKVLENTKQKRKQVRIKARKVMTKTEVVEHILHEEADCLLKKWERNS